MEEYTPNSHKYKAEQAAKVEKEKITPVAKGKVRKKGEMTKIKDVFISEDAANVKSYVLMDVLVPALKKAVSDIVTNGIDMILYGETGHSKKRNGDSRISYRNYYEDRNSGRYERERARTSIYSFNDIVLDTKGEAEDVLDGMQDILDRYGMVSIADLYELVEITGEYTDHNYGWTTIATAETIRVRDGYKLKLPRPIPLK